MNFQLDDGRQCVYQWESGRYMTFSDIEECPTVSFFNPSSNEAYVVETENEDGNIRVQIPNELLQLDSKIRFYCTAVDTEGQYVEFAGVILLIPRQKPADYVYVPTEILTFENVLAKVTDLRDETEDLKDGTEQIKTDVQELKSDTQEIYNDTLTLKNDVTTLKSDTQALKNQAQASEESAEESAKIAERYAKGTEDGTAVTSGVGYQDNAKFWKEQAQAISLNLYLDDEGYLCQGDNS